eukprot:CAMPEP_0172813514 /NCGR_PEP_ID=MMETSP1075-20121228/10710_1 /TAXON_ID=2916 /ORGANISM="Ceratium fusus, Strain PA161109" /LENGTH=99 /DNA_ID=CAMNT_0013653225 /DNA_START=68 /DNA_END=363 /DNA_ORIENTATION=-
MTTRRCRATPVLSFALAVVAVCWLGRAFVPHQALRGAGSAAAAAAAAAVATPAFGAEEAAVTAGAAAVATAEAAPRIPLGGGFAINLDIPETGLVNIVV